MTTPRILIVHYSRTGTTQRLAEQLACALDADQEAIIDHRPRRGLIGWLRSAYEARRGLPAVIEPTTRDPSSYDVVVVGTPVWAGSVSSPTRAWLIRHRGHAPPFAWFCTCGGDPGDTFAQMTAEAGAPPVATLTVRQRELDISSPQITGFVTAIEQALHARRDHPHAV